MTEYPEGDYKAEALEGEELAAREGQSLSFQLVLEAWRTIPFGGLVATFLVRERERAAAAFVQRVAEEASAERIVEVLRSDPRVTGILVRAQEAATLTAFERKRLALSRAVTAAVLDDTKVDEADLIVKALESIEEPHARAMEAIRRVWATEEPGDRVRIEDNTALSRLTGRDRRLYVALESLPGNLSLVLRGQGLIDLQTQPPNVAGYTGWMGARLTKWGTRVLWYLREDPDTN